MALPTITWKTGKLSVSANKDSAAVVSLAVRLSKPSASVVTCDFLCGGDARSDAEDYGTGKNYTLSTTTVTIPAGALVPNTQPTLTVYNNPIYDIDRTAVVSLTNPTNARVRSGDKLQVKIVDNGTNRVYANALTGYGGYSCAGDGTTEDATNLQNLLNAVNTACSTDADGLKYGGVVEFPAGTYKISSQVTIPKGMTLVSKSGAIIKRNGYSNTSSWSALFVYGENPGAGKTYNPIVVKGLEFDGGADSDVPTIPGGDPYIDYQHNQSLGVNGSDPEGASGVTSIYVDSCYFHDSIAAGLQLSFNLIANVYKNTTTNNHQYGIQATYIGTSGVINLRNHTARNYLLVSWGDGFYNEGNNWPWVLNIDDCDYDCPLTGSPGADIMVQFQPVNDASGITVPGGQLVATLNNITITGNTRFFGGKVSLTVNDSTFNCLNAAEQTFGRIQDPTGFSFNNCTFNAVYKVGHNTGLQSSTAPIYWIYGTGWTITFINCTFTADDASLNATGVMAYSTNADLSDVITLTGCTFGPNLGTNISAVGATVIEN